MKYFQDFSAIRPSSVEFRFSNGTTITINIHDVMITTMEI